MDNSPLKYSDEADRSLGVAGMAISMVVWDGENMLAAISLDNENGQELEFTPDFFFAGNPRLSARLAWQELVKHLELSSAMLMGNAICRSYVGRHRSLTSSMNAAIKALVRDEARTVCSLDDDEIDALYNKTFSYLDRIFRHDGVASIAENFAGVLRRERRLSATEVLDHMRALNRL